MTGSATFSFHGRVFVSEWSLLVYVTLEAGSISASGQPGLFKFKTAVRIMTITTAHGAFPNFVMEGHRKRRLNLAVTTETKLRITRLQHLDC